MHLRARRIIDTSFLKFVSLTEHASLTGPAGSNEPGYVRRSIYIILYEVNFRKASNYFLYIFRSRPFMRLREMY